MNKLPQSAFICEDIGADGEYRYYSSDYTISTIGIKTNGNATFKINFGGAVWVGEPTNTGPIGSSISVADISKAPTDEDYYVDGDTGITLSGTDIEAIYSVVSEGLNGIQIQVSDYSQGTLTAIVTLK